MSTHNARSGIFYGKHIPKLNSIFHPPLSLCFRFTLYYFVGVVFNGWIWYRIVGACVYGLPLSGDGLHHLLDSLAVPSRASTGT